MHLERAVYEIALKADPQAWADRPEYENIGVKFHFSRLPDVGQDRVDSFDRAILVAHQALRAGILLSAYQRRDTGQVIELPAENWGQSNASNWFIDGDLSLYDPTLPIEGHIKAFVDEWTTDRFYEELSREISVVCDLFVRQDSFKAFLGSSTAPSEAKPERPGKKTKTQVPAIEAALRAEYPEGDPASPNRTEMLRRVQTRLGRAVSKASLDRARATAWR